MIHPGSADTRFKRECRPWLKRAHILSAALIVAVFLPLAFFCSGCRRSPEQAKAEALSRAAQYESKDRYASAVIEYRNALKVAPDDVDLLLRLGHAYLQDGDTRAAVAQYERVLVVAPPMRGWPWRRSICRPA